MKTFKEFLLQEKAPPSKKAEEWIKANKQEFKDQYGDEWEEVLYATAWKMFGENIDTVECDLFTFLYNHLDKLMTEESTSASTTTAGVDNPDSPPLFKKSKFMGHPCLEVDDETYSQCIRGKIPFKRWKNYVKDDTLRDEMKSMYQKNKKMLIKNSRTGGMVFVK